MELGVQFLSLSTFILGFAAGIATAASIVRAGAVLNDFDSSETDMTNIKKGKIICSFAVADEKEELPDAKAPGEAVVSTLIDGDTRKQVEAAVINATVEIMKPKKICLETSQIEPEDFGDLELFLFPDPDPTKALAKTLREESIYSLKPGQCLCTQGVGCLTPRLELRRLRVDFVLNMAYSHNKVLAPRPSFQQLLALKGQIDIDSRQISAAETECSQVCTSLMMLGLRFAIRLGWCDVVRDYLRSCIPVSWDMMKLAVVFDRLEVLDELYTRYCCVNDLKIELLLEEAVCRGRIKIMDYLLGKWGHESSSSMSNLLVAAVRGGSMEAVQLLLERGAQPDIPCSRPVGKGHNRTPLVAAAARGRIEIAKLLLEAGARLDNGSTTGEATAIQVSIEARDPQMLSFLHDRGVTLDIRAKNAALKFALVNHDPDLAESLIQLGANVNTKVDIYGNVLQYAAINGSREMVTLLLNLGAAVNERLPAFGGNCPLMAAAPAGRTDIVRLLLKHGAEIDGAEGKFGNLLQTAATLGFHEIVAVALKVVSGIDVHATTAAVKNSALCLAMAYWLSSDYYTKEANEKCKYPAVIRYLTHYGADLTAEDRKYWEDRGGVPGLFRPFLYQRKQSCL